MEQQQQQQQQQNAQIQYDGNTGDLYLETYLIDALGPNRKGWGISPEAIKDRAMRSLNHPLTLYRKGDIFDHPISELGSNDHDSNRKLEIKYSIGRAARIKEAANNLFHAVYKITNPDAKRFLLKLLTEGNRTIPLFTSPGILRTLTEDRANIKDFMIVHNAIVTHPANDEAKAQIKEACIASAANGNCSHMLTGSAESEPEQSQQCEYCMAKALDQYLSSINATNENASHSIMSDSTATTAAAVNAAAVPPQMEEPKAPISGANGYTPTPTPAPAATEANEPPTKPKAGLQKTEAPDWEARYNDLSARFTKLEKDREHDNRVGKIQAIFYNFGLRDIYPEDQDYEKRIEHYANKGSLSIEEIADLVQTEVVKHQIKTGQLVQSNASLSPGANESPCQLKTPETASQEVTTHSLVTQSRELETGSISANSSGWGVDLINEIFANAERDAARYEQQQQQQNSGSSLLAKSRKGGLV
jgi:hypothetical protein